MSVEQIIRCDVCKEISNDDSGLHIFTESEGLDLELDLCTLCKDDMIDFLSQYEPD